MTPAGGRPAAVRVAVIGAGRMGRTHLAALARTRHARAVAIVDPDPAARQRAARAAAPAAPPSAAAVAAPSAAAVASPAALESAAPAPATPTRASAPSPHAAFPGPATATRASAPSPPAAAPTTFATVDDLLAAGGFDAALIAAPTSLHLELVRRLAAAGVPMLCEKPCGLTAEQAAAAARAASDAGVLLQIGYWRRFVPALVALRERVRAGALGEPALLIGHQWDEAPPAPGFRAHSGGIAVDMAVHEIDQARWLLGQEFSGEVQAVGGAPGEDPDTVVATARLSGGAVAALTLGRRFPPGDSCWCELFATGGYERIEFMTGASAQEAFLSALAAQADAFASAVSGATPGGAGGSDAVAALEVAERIGAALTRPA